MVYYYFIIIIFLGFVSPPDICSHVQLAILVPCAVSTFTPDSKGKRKSYMIRSPFDENLLPLFVGSIIKYLQ